MQGNHSIIQLLVSVNKKYNFLNQSIRKFKKMLPFLDHLCNWLRLCQKNFICNWQKKLLVLPICYSFSILPYQYWTFLYCYIYLALFQLFILAKVVAWTSLLYFCIGFVHWFGSLGIAPTRNCTHFLKIGYVVARGGILFLLYTPRELNR